MCLRNLSLPIPVEQAIDQGFPRTKCTRRITHLRCSNSIRGGPLVFLLTKKVTTFPRLREAKPSEKGKKKEEEEEEEKEEEEEEEEEDSKGRSPTPVYPGRFNYFVYFESVH